MALADVQAALDAAELSRTTYLAAKAAKDAADAASLQAAIDIGAAHDDLASKVSTLNAAIASEFGSIQ